MTIIHSNGSKFAGDDVDTIDDLLVVLSEWQLDRDRFEQFIECDGSTVRFFGNFKRLSHVFRIDTDDADVIEKLTQAIRDNERIKYDPVNRFLLCVVKDCPEAGRYERTWEDDSWKASASGRALTMAEMQSLANRGRVTAW